MRLTSTDKVQLTTSSTANIAVVAFWTDMPTSSGRPTFDNTPTAISTATTTDIVAAPASGYQRTVNALSIRNTHATTANTVTVVLDVSGTDYELHKVTLSAGETLTWTIEGGWAVTDSLGRPKLANNSGIATVNDLTTVVLASDVTNNNAIANSIADVTGLSFPVVAGGIYYFEFSIFYTAAAATTGSRWSITGPGSPSKLIYASEYSLTATTTTRNAQVVSYDNPAACNATSASTGHNMADIWGWIEPTSDGNVIARFASEVANSAIVAKAGSRVQYMRHV